MEREKGAEDVGLDAIRAEAKESEEIGHRVEALMASGEDGGNGKKRKKRKRNKGKNGYSEKQGLIRRIKGWSRRRKIITAMVIVIVAVFISSRSGGSSRSTGVMVDILPLSKQPIQRKLSSSGPVPGTDNVDVVSNIHTEITTVNAKEDNQVCKDQVLTMLDSTSLERKVWVAQGAYDPTASNKREKDKEAALGYEKAIQDFQEAGMSHSRSSQPFATGDISQMDLKASANTLNDVKCIIDGYTMINGKGVADKSYEPQIENAQYGLEKKTGGLEDTQIKGTTDGTVVRVDSKVGQFADKVEDDKPILSIENLEQSELEIKVSEFSIGRVKIGQLVTINTNILDGGTVDDEVTKISPTGEEKRGGSTERIIPITIRVDEQDAKLIAGITAKTKLLIKESEGTFVTPTTAPLGDGDITYIAIVQDLKVKRIPVTTGVGGDVLVEVIPTNDTVLEEGIQVIQNPNPMMVDGVDVIVCPQ